MILECAAVGIPPPQFTWLRSRGNQNETLLNSTSFTITNTTQLDFFQLENSRGAVYLVNSTLTINPAVDNDTGSYFCIASSIPGSDSQEIQLVVQGTLQEKLFCFLKYFYFCSCA